MPKGEAAFDALQKRNADKQAAFAATKADFLDIQDGDEVVVRFLEQGPDLTFALCHRVPVAGREWPQDVICLDQEDEGVPCPCCQSAHKGIRSRSTRGYVNVIWRDGPVYKRNEYGSPEKVPNSKQKVVLGHADGIFLWKPSKTVFADLVQKDKTWRGLMSRDFKITRKGAGKDDTKYFVEPADPDAGPVPMLVADLALAEKKYNIDEITTPPTAEEMVTMLSGLPGGEVQQQQAVPQGQSANDVFSGDGPMRSSAFTRG